MDSHDGADISGQITSASSDCQILLGVESIRIDHEVSVVLVYSRRLASIAAVEELGQGFLFDVRNLVHIKPGAVAG